MSRTSAALPPLRSAPPRAATRLLLVAAVAGLLVGCGTDEETNDVGESPTQGQVVRTPAPLGTDLPSTDPPLTQQLPGPTGGVPGEATTTAPEASPGEDADGGGPPGN